MFFSVVLVFKLLIILFFRSHAIEEGLDRILTQVLTPNVLSIFEQQITMTINEYFGLPNKTALSQFNGMLNSIFSRYLNIFSKTCLLNNYL